MTKINRGEKLPDKLLDSEVVKNDGKKIALKELITSATPNALIFIRHFGCLGCSLQMEDLAPRMTEMKRLGLNTVIIGSGEAEYIDGFMQRFELDDTLATIVTDSTLKIHEEAGLKRSLWATLGPKGVFQQLKALLTGHSQDGIKGDNWQQGGAVVLNDRGEVVYFRVSSSVGDFTPSVELVDTIQNLLIKKSDPLVM